MENSQREIQQCWHFGKFPLWMAHIWWFHALSQYLTCLVGVYVYDIRTYVVPLLHMWYFIHTKPNQYTKFVVWHNNIAVRHLYLVVVKSCSSASIFSSKIEVSVYRKRVKSEVWIVGDNSYKFFFYHDFLVIFSKESIEFLL